MTIVSHINETKDLTIVIPAAIASLPGLTLLEKAALARIAKFPGTSNARLAKLTGLTLRGVETMLARLRKNGFIQQVGRGRARRHKLMFLVEPRTKCGKDEGEQSHKICGKDGAHESLSVGACKREEPMADFIRRNLGFYEIDFNFGKYAYARKHLEEILARLELETDLSAEEKAKFVGEFTHNVDRCIALEVGAKLAEKLSSAKQEQLARVLGTATPEKLAHFRQQIEAGQLGWNAVKLLTLPDD